MGFKFKIDDEDSLEIVQGEDKSPVFRVMDKDLNPIDFTGASIVAQFPKADGIGVISRRSANLTFASADVSAADDEITLEDHGLVNDDAVTLTTDDTLPTGLSLATTYYVIVVDKDTFSLAASAGGSAINITAVGAGTHTVVLSVLALDAVPKLGKFTVTLSDAVTSAMKAGEKQAIEIEYTISGVTRVVQMSKALSVLEQAH